MEYKHFSHNHTLTLYKLQSGQHFQCHGCQSQCNDSVFACWTCNFFLHEHCGNANRYVKHPCHPLHPLVLMPRPTYCSSSFICNACGAPGSSFSYCCALCEVDLHTPCAYLPLKVKHHNHHHDIYLCFKGSDNKESPQHCKICTKEMSSKHWLYYCDKAECDFHVHTFCATTEVKTGLYQDDELEQVQSAPPPAAEEALADMFQLQMQLQMAHQLNQMFK
ncbi:hypothetical protein ACS0TY_033688 [Phlomoides rotata]